MSLCKWYGYPDLFITFTCNPKWPELCRILDKLGLQAADRPDLVSRLFKLKLDNLISAIKDEHILGRVKTVVYTVEFQKRGLPHAHICLFFRKEDKLTNPEDMDRIICAELPDKEKDPELFKLVSEFMIHGPCGTDNPTSPCTNNRKCRKKFPKEFNNHTYIDKYGYPVYQRCNTGATIEKNGILLDNRYVVGYNAYLLKRYQAHINIEWCNQLGSIKYLFKYINKGPDRITVGFSNINKHPSNPEQDNHNAENEIKNYYDARYDSACEASWRLFGFEMHYQTPHTERLTFHLEGEAPVCYEHGVDVSDVLGKDYVGQSQFTQWMEINKTNARASELTYIEFPKYFVWNKKDRVWTERKRGFALGRISYVPPKAGELFYLRVLLNKVKGPTCYKDIKKVDNFTYDTFRDACYALGLLDDDKEYVDCIEETSKWSSGSYCRSLFVMLITNDTLSRPDYVWEKTWQFLSDDILHTRCKELRIPDLELDDSVIKNIALAKIEDLLQRSGLSLKGIPNMPYPDFDYIDYSCNMLIQEELSYDTETLKQEHAHLYRMMTDEQKSVYHKITDAVIKGEGGVFVVYGYGGTGKTFLWKTLAPGIRPQGRIVINVASSGIASLLLTGGRTAHSRIAIPINLNEDYFCNISSDSSLAGLLQETDLIIWDEAPMLHRHCFEVFDRTLRDKVDQKYSTTPFGGKVIVFGGDFRQIVPVIPKERREDIILMKQIFFAKWIFDIGEGNIGGPNDGKVEIHFPEDVLIRTDGDHVHSITNSIYPSMSEDLYTQNYFQDRAILVPTNDEVEYLNDYMLSKIDNEKTIYLSSDSICSTELSSTFEESLYSPEILNSFKVSGFPNHKLSIKIGVPVICLRNIDQSNGLCNGTRLQVIRVGTHIIEAKVLSGNNVGYIAHIPRMKMIPSDVKIPVKFQRRQFPLMVCFYLTINKSQGQSLSIVGLFLRRPVFIHGQLYVTVSRVKSKMGLKVLICDNNGNATDKTVNVVYKEVLQKIGI